MTDIILSDEQTRVLSGGSLPIVILNSRGTEVAEISSLPEDDIDVRTMTEKERIAECVRRVNEAGETRGNYPSTQEALARLRAIKAE